MDKDVIIDFKRMIILAGWQENVFDLLTQYIETRSAEVKKKTQQEVFNIVKNYVDEKHSYDARYRSWNEKRQNYS